MNILPQIEFAWPVAIGVVVIAMTFAIGLGIGVWLGNRRRPTHDLGTRQTAEAVELMNSVQTWARSFAGDISEFHEKMQVFQDQLDAEGVAEEHGSGSPLFNLIGEIVDANETLRSKLNEAETSLDEKAKEVSSYLSEARTDPLTHLANRRSFDDEMSRRFSEWQRFQSAFCVLLVDIDHFKKFNDTHGHLAGDSILQQIAACLVAGVREADLVARFGGEEFAVILPRAELDDARLIAHRLVTSIERTTFFFEDKKLTVTASLGVAQIISTDSTMSLIKRADAALYDAKLSGRNRACYHDGDQSLPVIPSKSPLANDPDVPAKLLGVCDDLREKLIEVTKK